MKIDASSFLFPNRGLRPIKVLMVLQRGGYTETHTHTQNVKQHRGQAAADRYSTFAKRLKHKGFIFLFFILVFEQFFSRKTHGFFTFLLFVLHFPFGALKAKVFLGKSDS